ncbi:hypothetical protein [Geoanaerobacter pelophilus]|nr:hypothetical protein [Geoanaerobacter pelophilus]
MTDESMSLVSSQFPSDVRVGLTSYHLYTALFFHAVGQNIIAFRLVRLVMAVIAGAVFYVGLNRFLATYQINNRQAIFAKASVISWLGLGSLFAYAWFEPSPNYNSLNSFALTVSSGLLLLLMGDPEKISDGNLLKSRLILIAIGLCIGLIFFVKFTTAIILLLLYGVFICSSAQQSIKNKLHDLLIVIGGISLWLLLHFFFIQSPVLWWRYFFNGLQVATTMSAGYDASSLNRYILEVGSLARSAIYDFWVLHLVLLLGLGGIRSKKSGTENVKLIITLLVAVFVAAFWLSLHRNLYVGGQSQWFNLGRFYLSWLLLLSNAVISSCRYNIANGYIIPKQNVVKLFIVGIWLFCLPFAGAVGTGNHIYINMLMNMAPWFGVLLLLVTLLSWLYRSPWLAQVMCLLFSLFACSQIVTGSFNDPYRLLTGLSGQTQATQVGYPATTLKLDPMTSEYFNQVKALAHKSGFKPGDDVIGLYDLPGVVFAIGARSPALSWFIGNPRKSPAATAEKALSFADRERLKHAFILQSSKSDRIMPDLAKFGLNFPSGYMLCGEVNNPYDSAEGTVRLWKPL